MHFTAEPLRRGLSPRPVSGFSSNGRSNTAQTIVRSSNEDSLRTGSSPPATADNPHARHVVQSTASLHVHARAREDRIAALRRELESLLEGHSVGLGGWTLELGCGHGHFLSAWAAQHTEQQCIGIDFCRDRVRRAERKLHRSGLANLHFKHAEAGEFLAALPSARLFRHVFVLFPDPWPKRRHRKHRLVRASLLTTLARVCGTGSEFFFRSDAIDYVEEVAGFVEASVEWRRSPVQELPFETPTVFQAKAERFGSVAAVCVT